MPEAPVLRRLLPDPAELRAEEIYRDLRFPDPPSHRPYTTINMVSTADGKITVNDRAGGIGGPVDRLAMRVLRSRVDAVMVGAGTVRAEKINLGVPPDLDGIIRGPEPLGIVVSASGDVPLYNLAENSGERLLFLVSDESSREAVEALSARGEVRRLREMRGGSGYFAALSVLRHEYGVRSLLVEGGPSLNHALISSELVDELFLTLAPKLAGGGAGNILSGELFGGAVEMRLLSVYEADGELYLRYALEQDQTD
ncbi:pyrimidine reductase family protein [soil metagenome]